MPQANPVAVADPTLCRRCGDVEVPRVGICPACADAATAAIRAHAAAAGPLVIGTAGQDSAVRELGYNRSRDDYAVDPLELLAARLEAGVGPTAPATVAVAADHRAHDDDPAVDGTAGAARVAAARDLLA